MLRRAVAVHETRLKRYWEPGQIAKKREEVACQPEGDAWRLASLTYIVFYEFYVFYDNKVAVFAS